MAIQAIVTKKSVKLVMPKLFSITLNLVLSDDGVEKLNQDFFFSYKPGDAPADRLKEVKEQMQDAIDNYKNEQQIFNSNALNNAVTILSGGLTL